MSLCVVEMNRLEEAVGSVNSKEQELAASDPYKFVRSESHALVEPNEKKI